MEKVGDIENKKRKKAVDQLAKRGGKQLITFVVDYVPT